MANRPRHPGAPPAQQPPRKPPSKARSLEDHAPWKPTPYQIADVSAFQALQRGEATPDQQQRALRYLIALTGVNDFPYRPGDDGARDTDLALGKMFVGLQLKKMLVLNVGALQRSEPRADPPEPKS